MNYGCCHFQCKVVAGCEFCSFDKIQKKKIENNQLIQKHTQGKRYKLHARLSNVWKITRQIIFTNANAWRNHFHHLVLLPPPPPHSPLVFSASFRLKLWKNNTKVYSSLKITVRIVQDARRNRYVRWHILNMRIEKGNFSTIAIFLINSLSLSLFRSHVYLYFVELWKHWPIGRWNAIKI